MNRSTLKEFLLSNTEREKILIVRDRKWAMDELDLCALDGIPSIGVHIMTPEEVLFEYLAPERHLLSKGEGCAVVDQVLRRLQHSGELTYYSEEINSPSLTAELWSAISEVRMSAYERREEEVSNVRLSEFLKILEAYEAELDIHDYKDMAKWWEKVQAEQMNPEYLYAVYADISLSYRERLFLEKLPNLTVLVRYDVGELLPKSFFSTEKDDYTIKHYFSDEKTLSHSHSLRFQRHYLATQEVRAIFQDFQRKKISPAEVEIVFADARYGSLLFEAAQIFSVQAEMADGYDASPSLLSDWFSAFEKFVSSGCGFLEFEKLISKHLLHFSVNGIETLMESLRQRMFHAGKENYAFPKETELASDQISEEERMELRVFLKELIELVPESMFETISLKSYGKKLRDFLNRYVSRIRKREERRFSDVTLSEREKGWIRQLDAWEEQWKYVGEEELNCSKIFHRLIQMCSSFPLQKPPFYFPSILVRSVSSRRPWTRRHCYLCGLTADNFPLLVEESSVLNDAEKRWLSDTLPTSETKNEEEKYAIRKLLASYSNQAFSDSGRSLTFSCSRFDLSTNTEIVSSVIPERLASAYGEPGWTEYGFYSKIRPKENEESEFQWIAISSEERGAIRQWMEHFPFSASSIDQLMQCPQCFYYRYILNLSKEQTEEADEWKWLSPKNKGLLCHDIIHAFLQQSDMLKNASSKRSWTLFSGIMREKIEEERKKIPPTRRRVFEDAVLEIHDALRQYFQEILQLELGREGRIFSEKGFSEVIRIGKYPIHLKGRIDYMHLSDSEILITDYKTGRRKTVEEKSRLNELFQDMLYAEAMRQYFGEEKSIRTQYHFLFSSKEDLCFQEENAPERMEDRKKKIETMLDLVLEYGFVSSKYFAEMPTGYEILKKSQVQVDRSHQYSDFREICR